MKHQKDNVLRNSLRRVKSNKPLSYQELAWNLTAFLGKPFSFCKHWTTRNIRMTPLNEMKMR